MATVLVCFQVGVKIIQLLRQLLNNLNLIQTCMILSSVYHTFSCRSEKHYECFLSFDLLGIALSLLAIYISGIYYAFWCDLVSDEGLVLNDWLLNWSAIDQGDTIDWINWWRLIRPRVIKAQWVIYCERSIKTKKKGG